MSTVGILAALVLGTFLGVLGRLVAPGRAPIPIWLTVVVGIVAAFVGGFIARLLGLGTTSGIDWAQLIIQLVVAVVGIVGVSSAYGRRTFRDRGAYNPPQPISTPRAAPPVSPVRERRQTATPPAAASTPRPDPPPAPARPASTATPRPRPSGIFISYRRSDARHAAGRIADRLRDRFGRSEVFMDVDSLRIGSDFQEGVRAALRNSAVVLVIIGEEWIDARDLRGRRLDDPEDNVRMEVEMALDLGRALPVLLDDAAMPTHRDLPEPLSALPRLNALHIGHISWDADVSRLITLVDEMRST